ncbi:MAG: SO_0444 family Cu/Zn efflux transporter [Candidatus Delongbacteria bacterium]|nr:SO_0444 family Cu/Zn efflux transporter [Candidatus Delongbacteria bacterium]
MIQELFINLAAEFWLLLQQMAPWLLFGFLVAGLLSFFIPRELVERKLGGNGFGPVLKAALIGIPLPICSCGVIPLGASLRQHGASRGATTAFLLSTPQTGVDSIMVTWSLLGPVFAIFRPLAALVTGLVGGSLAAALDDQKEDTTTVAECRDDCCTTEQGSGRIWGALRHGLVTLPRDIGGALLLGLLIAAALSLALPDDFFAPMLGTGIVAILVMMAAGIPVYVCATASVPVALTLMAKGVSPGAALAFLITGPATNAVAVATVWRILGRRTALVFLGTVAIGALLAGVLFDALFSEVAITGTTHLHEMLPGWLENGSAVLLLLVLANGWFRRGHSGEAEEQIVLDSDTAAETVQLQISGMTCDHCVSSVKVAAESCQGVKQATVNLKQGTATIKGNGFETEALTTAIEMCGFKVVTTTGS